MSDMWNVVKAVQESFQERVSVRQQNNAFDGLCVLDQLLCSPLSAILLYTGVIIKNTHL